MTDGNTNFAHVPGAGASPIDTHGTETPHESTAPAEIAAGTVNLANVAPTKIDPVRVGIMEDPVISPEPSGARVQSFSPLGRHDVDSSGR